MYDKLGIEKSVLGYLPRVEFGCRPSPLAYTENEICYGMVIHGRDNSQYYFGRIIETPDGYIGQAFDVRGMDIEFSTPLYFAILIEVLAASTSKVSDRVNGAKVDGFFDDVFKLRH